MKYKEVIELMNRRAMLDYGEYLDVKDAIIEALEYQVPMQPGYLDDTDKDGKAIDAISVQLEISCYLVKNKISELIKNGELSKRDRATFWTDEKVNKLKEMYKKGYKYEEIAKQLNTTGQAITGRVASLKRSGELSYRSRGGFWTDERDALLKDMYKQGYTQVNMAEALGKSKGAINARIVKLRAMGELDE